MPELHRPGQLRPRAFTLVELLVVIGIIGVLVGTLLPALTSARDRARTVACSANFRSLGQAMIGYAGENKGSMPWGMIWEQPDWNTGKHVPGQTAFKNWPSIISYYLNRNRPFGDLAGSNGDDYANQGLYKELSPVLRCQETVGLGGTLMPSYTANPIIFRDFRGDYEGNSYGGAQYSGGGLFPVRGTYGSAVPAKLNKLYNDNALLWDSPAIGAGSKSADGAFVGIAYSGIDQGGLMLPLTTAYRFRGPNEDPDVAADPYYGQNFMVLLPEVDGGGVPWGLGKEDCINGFSNGKLGNLRFRHNRGSACNVLFADGSVKSVLWNPKRPGAMGPGFASTEFLRKWLMIKWPTGVEMTY